MQLGHSGHQSRTSAFSTHSLVVLAVDDVVQLRLRYVAPLPEQSGPQLDADDSEDEEDEEAEEEHVAEHGQGVEQEHHEDAHTCREELKGVRKC